MCIFIFWPVGAGFHATPRMEVKWVNLILIMEIVGNSSMLGCISDSGELLRLFWPNIDYPQHIEKFKVGIYERGKRSSTCWLDSCGWQSEQHYKEDTNILITLYKDDARGIKVRQSDFAVPGKDILIRYYEVENIGAKAAAWGFAAYSSVVSTNPQLAGIIYETSLDALIHYRNNYYVSISGQHGNFKIPIR